MSGTPLGPRTTLEIRTQPADSQLVPGHGASRGCEVTERTQHKSQGSSALQLFIASSQLSFQILSPHIGTNSSFFLLEQKIQTESKIK